MRKPHYDEVTPFGILCTGFLGIAIGAAIGGPLASAQNGFDEERVQRIERERVAVRMESKEVGQGYWRR